MRRRLPEWFEEDRWVPPPGYVEQLNVTRFMAAHGIDDYADLLERAADDPEWFYPAAFDDLNLPWPHPYDVVCDTSRGVPWARWFVGGATNIAHLAIERWRQRGQGAAQALIWEGEDGSTRTYTFDELGQEVARVAAGLRTLDVDCGDVVALYLPMIPEAAIITHAAVRIGAIVAPAFSGYGTDALAERLTLSEAKVVVTADGTLRGGSRIEMAPTAREAVTRAAGVEHLVHVSRLGHPCPEGAVPWDELREREAGGDIEMFGPDVPCLLAFTSGSTGRPKGAVHAHGRMPYRVAIELAYNFDLRAGDRLTWVTDMGWIMGPFVVICPLLLGATSVIFEGLPNYPQPDRLWASVDRHGLTHLGLAPTVIRAQAGYGHDNVDRHGLDSLRVLGSTGEPMTSSAWRWLHRHVGRGIRPIINYSGGTEVGCGLLAGSPAVTMRECAFAGPTPGIAAAVFDENGQRVVGEIGELVVTKPWPSMTLGFWNDDERYLDTYWSRWPDIWLHGDRAIEHEDGSWELPGRSDDLIKVAGKRVGPVEFEAAATAVHGVQAAATVGVPDEVKGEVAVVVVLPDPGMEGRVDELARAVESRIVDALGKPMRPAAVVVADEIPITRSGKVHRRVVRAWLTDTDPGDLSTLENPSAEAAIKAARRQLTTQTT